MFAVGLDRRIARGGDDALVGGEQIVGVGVEVRDAADHGGAGDQVVAVGEQPLQQVDVAGIPLDQTVARGTVVRLGNRPVFGEVVESDDLVTAGQQTLHHITADESGCSGHQYLAHLRLPTRFSGRSPRWEFAGGVADGMLSDGVEHPGAPRSRIRGGPQLPARAAPVTRPTRWAAVSGGGRPPAQRPPPRIAEVRRPDDRGRSPGGGGTAGPARGAGPCAGRLPGYRLPPPPGHLRARARASSGTASSVDPLLAPVFLLSRRGRASGA